MSIMKYVRPHWGVDYSVHLLPSMNAKSESSTLIMPAWKSRRSSGCRSNQRSIKIIGRKTLWPTGFSLSLGNACTCWRQVRYTHGRSRSLSGSFTRLYLALTLAPFYIYFIRSVELESQLSLVVNVPNWDHVYNIYNIYVCMYQPDEPGTVSSCGGGVVPYIKPCS